MWLLENLAVNNFQYNAAKCATLKWFDIKIYCTIMFFSQNIRYTNQLSLNGYIGANIKGFANNGEFSI